MVLQLLLLLTAPWSMGSPRVRRRAGRETSATGRARPQVENHGVARLLLWCRGQAARRHVAFEGLGQKSRDEKHL